jgi:hypothetical protein
MSSSVYYYPVSSPTGRTVGFLFSSASHRLSVDLVSVPRFDVMIFPLFVVIALAGTPSRTFHRSYVVLSSMLAALFVVMHSQWNWVA